MRTSRRGFFRLLLQWLGALELVKRLPVSSPPTPITGLFNPVNDINVQYRRGHLSGKPVCFGFSMDGHKVGYTVNARQPARFRDAHAPRS